MLLLLINEVLFLLKLFVRIFFFKRSFNIMFILLFGIFILIEFKYL